MMKGYLFIMAAALLILAATTSSARHCRFPAIFNFGDSNSDTGSTSVVVGEYPPPYGGTFFKHPAGRASDGRLIIDFIAERLEVPYLHAYLDSFRPNFTHGVNFATGGSTILPTNTTLGHGGGSQITLAAQSRQFTQFQTRSQQLGNQGGGVCDCEPSLPKEKDFSRALYTFDIGQNDLGNAYKMNLSTDQVKLYVPDLLQKLSEVIKGVYEKGGRTFWIHNAGPIGCLPYTLVHFPVTPPEIDEHGCFKPHNDAAQFFNLKLKEKVAQLRSLLPLASITYVDIFSVKFYLISNANKLGFDDPLLVCCGQGGTRCGDKEYLNSTCAKPQSRIIWDGLHYTEAANKWVVNQIVDGSFSDPPLPLNLACDHNRH